MQEQLGLKSITTSIDVLVIDHVEEPTPDWPSTSNLGEVGAGGTVS
jgi:hypothetical protein